EATRAASAAASLPGDASDSRLERKVESAMNEAIDDFVRAAMDALPAGTNRGAAGKNSRSKVPRSTLLSTPPPPVPGPATSRKATNRADTSDTGEDDRPGGGAFARELRRKMSVMAERLFPG